MRLIRGRLRAGKDGLASSASIEILPSSDVICLFLPALLSTSFACCSLVDGGLVVIAGGTRMAWRGRSRLRRSD